MSVIMELFSMIIAFDCWLDTRDINDYDLNLTNPQEYMFKPNHMEMRITYHKLMLWAAMPIVCCIGSFLVWYSISWYHGSDSETMYTKFLSTLIIMLFIVHPLITQYFIQMFDCQEYDGDNRL